MGFLGMGRIGLRPGYWKGLTLLPIPENRIALKLLKGPHVLLDEDIVLGKLESIFLQGLLKTELMRFQNFLGHGIIGEEGGFDLVPVFLDFNHQPSQLGRLQGETDDFLIVFCRPSDPFGDPLYQLRGLNRRNGPWAGRSLGTGSWRSPIVR